MKFTCKPATTIFGWICATGQTELARETARRTNERVDRALAHDASDTNALTYKALTHAFFGESEEAKKLALRVKAIDPESPGIDFNLACTKALLGEPDIALDCLETCFSRVDPATFVSWTRRDTDLNSLRDLPRFKQLLVDLEARVDVNEAVQPH